MNNMPDIVETEPGVYSVLHEGASYEVRALGDEITVNGHRFDMKKRARSAVALTGPARLVAPMPGKIVRILVTVGEAVTAGRGIVVVEAMKMQNELKAPRAGRVTAIEVKANDSVTAGTVLAVIE